MISDNIIKQKFIVDTLKDAADFAFRAQSAQAHVRLKKRTGIMFAALDSPDYVIQASGSHFVISAYIVKSLRFQDMGVRSLYTKPLFGSLKHAHGKLQYGLREELKEAVREQLENALKPQ